MSMQNREEKREKKLMWDLEVWGMLLGHHLTERTSKRCMYYVGRYILRVEEKYMENEVKEFKVAETNEAALKDWTPLRDRDLEESLGKPSNGRSEVYSKINGIEFKTIITLSDAKFEIVVGTQKNPNMDILKYNWELALIMDEYITLFLEGKSHNTMKERLKEAMELLCSINAEG
ncbi:hypothetical protein PENTCL1PPCAC_28380, partial [Pristionchus entomophagus]